jgi:hypothetical protein
MTWVSVNNQSVGELAIGMLSFFGSFAYDSTVVCIVRPGTVLRDACEGNFGTQFSLALADPEAPTVNMAHQVLIFPVLSILTTTLFHDHEFGAFAFILVPFSFLKSISSS